MAIQLELDIASHVPFQDYGIDIDSFGEFEGGVLCQDYQRTEFDYHPKEEERIKLVKTYRTELKSLRYKIVPEKYIGKLGKGYMLQRVD